MQFFIVAISALASLAAAAPNYPPPGGECTPPSYQCLSDASGWQVCSAQGQWVFAGNCPPDTECKFYEPSASPYCVPPGFSFP